MSNAPNAGKISKAQYRENLALEASEATHFTTEECRSLIYIYEKLTEQGKLDRLRFRDFLHSCFELTDDLMLDLTFRFFDESGDGLIQPIEFVIGLSKMMRGDLKELVDVCYSIYDINGDGCLTREEFQQCLKGTLLPGYGLDPDEIEDGERELAQILMKKLDINKDGQVTREDFEDAVSFDPLLIQCCGVSLPSPKTFARFLFLFTNDYRSYTGEYLNSGPRPGQSTSGGSIHPSRTNVRGSLGKNTHLV